MARGVQFDMPVEQGMGRVLGGERALGLGENKGLVMGVEKQPEPSLDLAELDEKLTAVVDEAPSTLEFGGKMPVSVAPAAAAVQSLARADEEGALAYMTVAYDESVVPTRDEPEKIDKVAKTSPKTLVLPLHTGPLTLLCAPSGVPCLPLPRPESKPDLETEAEPKSQLAPGPKSSDVPEPQSSSVYILEPETQSGRKSPSNYEPATRLSRPAFRSTCIQDIASIHTQYTYSIPAYPSCVGSTYGPTADSARGSTTAQLGTQCLDPSCFAHVSPTSGFLETPSCLSETKTTSTSACLPTVPGLSGLPVEATCPSAMASLSCTMPPDASCLCGLDSVDARGVGESLVLGSNLSVGEQAREEDEFSQVCIFLLYDR